MNERLLAPPGASALDQVSAAGFVGVDGEVAVLVSSPHAATIAAMNACTGHGDTKARRNSFLKLRASVPPWLVFMAIMGA